MPDQLDALTDSLNGTGQLKSTAEDLLSKDSEDEGKAVGEVAGRRMAVMPPENQQGMEALVAAISGIALLGLPVKGAITTAAVGSKL